MYDIPNQILFNISLNPRHWQPSPDRCQLAPRLPRSPTHGSSAGGHRRTLTANFLTLPGHCHLLITVALCSHSQTSSHSGKTERSPLVLPQLPESMSLPYLYRNQPQPGCFAIPHSFETTQFWGSLQYLHGHHSAQVIDPRSSKHEFRPAACSATSQQFSASVAAARWLRNRP